MLRSASRALRTLHFPPFMACQHTEIVTPVNPSTLLRLSPGVSPLFSFLLFPFFAPLIFGCRVSPYIDTLTSWDALYACVCAT